MSHVIATWFYLGYRWWYDVSDGQMNLYKEKNSHINAHCTLLTFNFFQTVRFDTFLIDIHRMQCLYTNISLQPVVLYRFQIAHCYITLLCSYNVFVYNDGLFYSDWITIFLFHIHFRLLLHIDSVSFQLTLNTQKNRFYLLFRCWDGLFSHNFEIKMYLFEPIQ